MGNTETPPTFLPASPAAGVERLVNLPHGEQRVGMTGPGERNLKILREALGVGLTSRQDLLRLTGSDEAVRQAADILAQLAAAARRGRPLTRQQVIELIADVGSGSRPVTLGEDSHGDDALNEDHIQAGLDVYLRGRRVRAMTAGQTDYLRAIGQHDLTFCCGPAGTGKTYLAVAAAVALLKQSAVRKIVLVRPAVEAGERLGFLPGTLQEKVNPYLRPLLDSLHDMMEFDQVERFMAADVIEIIPLAFMRGRTLNDAMIILDEAQNATRSQMLMFLTRLGHGSKMVVTGDTSQTDLEDPTQSGLIDAVHRLRRTPGISFVTLQDTDIVRHHLVQRIVKAYGQNNGNPVQPTE